MIVDVKATDGVHPKDSKNTERQRCCQRPRSFLCAAYCDFRNRFGNRRTTIGTAWIVYVYQRWVDSTASLTLRYRETYDHWIRTRKKKLLLNKKSQLHFNKTNNNNRKIELEKLEYTHKISMVCKNSLTNKIVLVKKTKISIFYNCWYLFKYFIVHKIMGFNTYTMSTRDECDKLNTFCRIPFLFQFH